MSNDPNLSSLDGAAPLTVRDAVFQFMRACGASVIFGNPGSTELPMFRSFPPDFEYVLGLQEAVVVGMADGYAQATSNAAFINLHSAAGVGNAMGNIYTAFKNQTPLVIVAGQQARSIQPFDAYLFSKQVTDLPRPYVKWCVEPARAEDVPLAIARAYYTAMQQPCGPVMVSVPSDDWDRPCAPVQFRSVSTRSRPDPEALALLKNEIAGSKKMALVVGAGIDRDGAWREAIELAQACQASVFVAPMAARCGFPETHALFQGFLPAARDQIRARLAGHDLIVVVGAPAFTYHVEGEGPHLPEGARLAILTEDPEVAAWAPQGIAVVGSIRLGLRDLLNELPRDNRSHPKARALPARAQESDPIGVAYVLQTLAELRDPSDIVVEEAPTARLVMHQYLPMSQPGTFYTMASGGLGFAMPAAVGIAMARRDRRVICVIGDGSSMYSIQCIWTAVQHRLNVMFLVLNNGRYAAMKRFAGVLGFSEEEKVVGIDIPGIEFDQLARAQGCPAEKITESGRLREALTSALHGSGPMLVEVVVT